MLTEISTFGWFGDDHDLLSVSTFGWYLSGIGPAGYTVAFAGAGFISTNDYAVGTP
jgi:hypothetical protein